MSSSATTLADGQVAATATAVLSAGTPGPVTAIFANTGVVAQSLIVTLKRGTGTARRLAKVLLAADEQMVIANLPLNADDTLYAQATDASVVDYLVVGAPPVAPLSIYSLDANGALKAAGVPNLEQLLLLFS